VLDRVERANAGEPITFFEVTAAAALQAFAETPADLLLLEVGLGGRYDATNVIAAPAAAVIAPVDIDHREFLGDTIEQIAGEKAGIIKHGRPAVIGRQSAAALAVLEAEAERLQAPMLLMGRDFDAWSDRGGLAWSDGEGLLDLPAPALFGPHQADNAGLAIAAARTLGDPRITSEAIAEGLRTASWPARFQRLTRGPLAERAAARGADLWLDGGHNPHGARAAARALAALQARDGRPSVLIAGMLGHKDAEGFFAAFAELKPRVLAIGFDAEKAADPALLAAVARAAGLETASLRDLDAALEQALAADGAPPRVLICGSLYLAGEVLARSPDSWPA
jgi:dihydrofolate synthase/folylpolyglutamate synthase